MREIKGPEETKTEETKKSDAEKNKTLTENKQRKPGEDK